MRGAVCVLVALQIVFICSEPGKVEEQSPVCIANAGLVQKCPNCGDKLRRHAYHSQIYDRCIPNYWYYDREMMNEVGEQNFWLQMLMTLAHFAVMLFYSSYFCVMCMRFSREMSGALGHLATIEEEAVIPNFWTNMLALVNSGECKKFFLLALIAFTRCYSLLSMFLTNLMLLKMGLPYGAYQQWRNNFKRLARGEYQLLEIMDKEEEVRFQLEKLDQNKDAEPLFGFKDMASFKLGVTHYMVGKQERLQTGDVITLEQIENDKRTV